MRTNLFSQLVIRLMDLEVEIEETMYFALVAEKIHRISDKERLNLPNFLLGEVRQEVTSSLYFDYFKSRKQKIIDRFPSYANLYAIIKLTASWEAFLIECLVVMQMGEPIERWTRELESTTRELIRREHGNKSGPNLLRELDQLYSLGIVSGQKFRSLVSIYKIRDCIAHRNGIISSWDFDKKSNVMATSWKKAVVKGEKGTTAWEVAGTRKFSTVLVRDNREWFENQNIIIEASEVCDIALNIIELGNKVFQRLIMWVNTHNIIPSQSNTNS